MQLSLTDQEAQALADALRGRLDQLGASIAKADSRSFREGLIREGDVLESVYRKLGCEYPEWAEAKACELPGEAAAG